VWILTGRVWGLGAKGWVFGSVVRALPDKQCLSDLMPTHVLKSSVDILAPFLSRLFCWSLEHGVVPLKMKAAHITPTLKKADLDPADAKSYRPISNLSVLSKLLERVVAKHLITNGRTDWRTDKVRPSVRSSLSVVSVTGVHLKPQCFNLKK